MSNYDKALEYAHKAERIWEVVLGAAHPYTQTAYRNLAEIYRETGDTEKAQEYMLKLK